MKAREHDRIIRNVTNTASRQIAELRLAISKRDEQIAHLERHAEALEGQLLAAGIEPVNRYCE